MTPLRRARLARKMTLAEVAAATGVDGRKRVDLGGLSKIERGEQRVSPELATRLAQAVGIADEREILYPFRYMDAAAGRGRQRAIRKARQA